MEIKHNGKRYTHLAESVWIDTSIYNQASAVVRRKKATTAIEDRHGRKVWCIRWETGRLELETREIEPTMPPLPSEQLRCANLLAQGRQSVVIGPFGEYVGISSGKAVRFFPGRIDQGYLFAGSDIRILSLLPKLFAMMGDMQPLAQPLPTEIPPANTLAIPQEEGYVYEREGVKIFDLGLPLNLKYLSLMRGADKYLVQDDVVFFWKKGCPLGAIARACK